MRNLDLVSAHGAFSTVSISKVGLELDVRQACLGGAVRGKGTIRSPLDAL